MRKLTKEEEALIDDLRLAQTGHGFNDEKRFKQLLNGLNAPKGNTQFIDFIFERVYASSTHSVEYLTFLKSRIYSNEKTN
jgi:hypothetical protein